MRTRRAGERFMARRAFYSVADAPRATVLLLVVTGLAASWAVSLAAGGERSGVRHLFYIPIMMVALRFGGRSAAATGIVAGLLAGPLLPAEMVGDTPQSTSGWMIRLLMYVVVGVTLAWMTRLTRPALLLSGGDAKVSAELRRALELGQVTVFFQPQVDLVDEHIVGLEALVRWRHPTRGLLTPADFVPAAERTGFIREIDNFVLQYAAQRLLEWSALGHRDLTLAVNVSAQRLHDDRLVADIAGSLEETGLDPARLHVEVTETAIILESESAARQLQALHDLGVRIAIDDFGVGQTSLSHLHRYAVDYLKIDRAFVSAVSDPKVSRLVGGLVKFIDAVDLVAVAEGIETRDQLEQLKGLRCPLGQGFYFAEPADSDLTLARLERSRAAHLARGGEGSAAQPGAGTDPRPSVAPVTPLRRLGGLS